MAMDTDELRSAGITIDLPYDVFTAPVERLRYASGATETWAGAEWLAEERAKDALSAGLPEPDGGKERGWATDQVRRRLPAMGDGARGPNARARTWLEGVPSAPRVLRQRAKENRGEQ